MTDLDLDQAMKAALAAEDLDAFDTYAAVANRRDKVAAQQRDTQARREFARGRRFDVLLARGVPEDVAVQTVYGVSVARQHRDRTIASLRAQGYQGAGLDELARAAFADHVRHEIDLAEASQDVGLVMVNKEGRALHIDGRSLWTGPLTRARRYASDELLEWWETHPRPDYPAYRAALDPTPVERKGATMAKTRTTAAAVTPTPQDAVLAGPRDHATILSDLADRMGVKLTLVPPVVDEPAPVTTAHQRPTSAATMVGQGKARVRLMVHITSALKRGQRPGHVLFYGAPGLGKTSMAELVAAETGGTLIRATASALNSPRRMARCLSDLEHGSVLFIDEVHGLNLISETLLYSAMEDGRIEYSSDGPGTGGVGSTDADVKSIQLEPFTLVAATTLPGRLSKPLLNRFALQLELEYYTDDQLAEIILNAAVDMPVDITEDACLALGRRARGTPRVALSLLDTARDYAGFITDDGKVTEASAVEAMTLEDIDELGLTSADRAYLDTLCKRFKGGPVGLDNLAVACDQDTDTVEDMIEPFLIRSKLIARFPRGRVATKAAFERLGLRPPADLGLY
jgi:Holliday junction DNA helicase RuvB